MPLFVKNAAAGQIVICLNALEKQTGQKNGGNLRIMSDFADDFLNDIADDQVRYDDMLRDGFEDIHDTDEHDFLEQFDDIHCSSEGPMSGFMPMSRSYDVEGMDWEMHSCEMYFKGLLSGRGQSIKDLFVFQNRVAEPRWYSNGKVYRVQDMSDSHLINAMNFLDKQGKGDEPIYKLMEKELEVRWDI